MKVSLAAADKDRAVRLAEALIEAGHEITSSWLCQVFKRTREHTATERAQIALRDCREVRDCDVLVLLDSPQNVPGGKFVETGLALAYGKRVIVSGRRENMLLRLPVIQQVPQDGLGLSALAG